MRVGRQSRVGGTGLGGWADRQVERRDDEPSGRQQADAAYPPVYLLLVWKLVLPKHTLEESVQRFV